MRIQHIQVRRRRFGYKAGLLFVAVKEYAKKKGGGDRLRRAAPR